MRKSQRWAAALASIVLASCQTLNGVTVNGESVAHIARAEPAQGESFCGRNLWLCIAGGVAVALVVTYVAIVESNDCPNIGYC